jgi:hypothetical protein
MTSVPGRVRRADHTVESELGDEWGEEEDADGVRLEALAVGGCLTGAQPPLTAQVVARAAPRNRC